MLSRLRVPKSLFLALVAVVATFGASMAFAAQLRNPGFEAGNFNGWTIDSEGGGAWEVYDAMDNAYRAPYEGDFAAQVTQGGPGSNLLLRKLRPKQDQRLSLRVAYVNTADRFASPNSLENPNGGGGPLPRRAPGDNQQLRVDLIKANAAPRTTRPGKIYKTLLRTRPGDRLRTGWKKLETGVSKLAGKRVVLRIAEVDNLGEFEVDVDRLKLRRR